MKSTLTGCGKCVLVFFIIINILCLLVGAALITAGSILVHNASSPGVSAFETVFSIKLVSAIIIVAGIVTFLVAVLAIVAGLVRSKILLGIYIVIVGLIILLELVAGIVAIIYRERVDPVVEGFMLRLISDYNVNGNSTSGDLLVLNTIQTAFMCCGWNNQTNYNRTILPEGCDCGISAPDERCTPHNGIQIWKAGCRDGVLNVLHISVGAVAGVGLFFALVEVLALLMACGLCCCIHREYDTLTNV